jgi:large subunit ribosomal protein L9
VQVVLNQDVPGLGRKGDMVTVKNGYARNYLFPKNLAVPATKGTLREHANLQSAQAEKEERLLAEARKDGDKIDGVTLVFKAKAGQGRIFGSVTAQEIAKRIAAQYKVKVDKRKVLLEENLKELGPHEVAIQLHPKVKVNLTVHIKAEEE